MNMNRKPKINGINWWQDWCNKPSEPKYIRKKHFFLLLPKWKVAHGCIIKLSYYCSVLSSLAALNLQIQAFKNQITCGSNDEARDHTTVFQLKLGQQRFIGVRLHDWHTVLTHWHMVFYALNFVPWPKYTQDVLCKSATDFPAGHKAYMKQTPPFQTSWLGLKSHWELHCCVTHYMVFLSAFFLYKNNTWERTRWQKTPQRPKHYESHRLWNSWEVSVALKCWVLMVARNNRWAIRNWLSVFLHGFTVRGNL